MPKDNKKDLEDVPKEVLKDLRFTFVEHMDEVWDVALTKTLQAKQETQMRTHHVLQRATPPEPVD
jgi:ATP-dependent Lon protease